MATIHQALLHNGIILYSRAVHTASKHRKQIDLRNSFTPEQLTVHVELCGLRNDAIAHFGPGKNYNGEWMRETIALQIFKDEPGRIAGVSRRLALDVALSQRAQVQTKTALNIVVNQFYQVNADLVEEINHNLVQDEVFREAMDQCTMDLGQSLGSEQALHTATAARVVGHSQGVIDH